MKKMIIGGIVLVAAGAAFRRFGPELHRLAMTKCEEMFEHMPEDFPPKRMMRGIEDVREQNSRILLRLAEEEPIAAVPGKG